MAEDIKTLIEGERLTVTRTGDARERFSRLYGVFLEDGKLILRNFPSQRIMGLWLDKTGWSLPEKLGTYVIMRGVPLKGLKVTRTESIGEMEMEGVGALVQPTQPRKPAAPKPEVPAGSQQDAKDSIDVTDSVTADAEVDADGDINV